MAKKSLKERIDALVNALGAAEKPSSAQIRNELVTLALDVEKLEDGEALAQKDARISDLETALERSDVQLGNLKIMLEEAGEELEAFRDEQTKREKEEREIDRVQFQILDLLPSPSGTNWLRSDEIARALEIPLDEADAYIEGLRKLEYIIFHHHDPGGGGWRRTESGNTLAVAKRWAGEADKKRHEYPDLGENHQAVLQMIARDESEEGLTEKGIVEKMGIRKSVIRFILRRLRDAGMATDAEKPGEAIASSGSSNDPAWEILPKGEEYLAERCLL